MWVLPVIDVRHGQVVRAVAGDRASYQPLRSPWAADACPATVLRGIELHFAPHAIYVADLDAIVDQQPRQEVWSDLASTRVPLLLDAGLFDLPVARQRLDLARQCALHDVSWVVGLESLRSSSTDQLEELADLLDPSRAIFSLDLREGQLLVHPEAKWPMDPVAVVDRAWQAGFRRLIVLDLARVGLERGVCVAELCQKLRCGYPGLELISGGGVRNRADLEKLAACGCDAALVATALHRGEVTRDDRWIV
jgi:HisA/HisF family protein